MSKTYFVIAGEASGDLHGSNLVKAIKKLEPDATFIGFGGDMMQKNGVKILKHIKDLAFMGFWEVLKNLHTILKNIRFCCKEILKIKPDAVILIDYPGFNLKIAKFCKQHNIKVIYYISPQLWAWKEGRVKQIRRYVDKMLVILPFEEDFYTKHNIKSYYVGHPLLDAIKNDEKPCSEILKELGLDDSPKIALLPGSREQEIKNMLPIMLKASQDFPDYEFIIAAAPSIELSFYEKFLKGYKNVKIISKRSYDILKISQAALVTSGTATLETALLNIPQIVCYKGSPISYIIAKNLIKVKYISLVNLILDKQAVTELIQSDLNSKNIKEELRSILEGEKRNYILEDYKYLSNILGSGGASYKAAEIIVS